MIEESIANELWNNQKAMNHLLQGNNADALSCDCILVWEKTETSGREDGLWCVADGGSGLVIKDVCTSVLASTLDQSTCLPLIKVPSRL